jgi:hypothetical protein
MTRTTDKHHPIRRKVATTVYLEHEQREQLRALSERTRVPVATYVRDGVALVIAQHEAQS